MNKVFLLGNLTRDVELRNTQSMPVGLTGIAVTRRGKKDEVDFFNLVAFGKTAETMAQYLEKGRKIAIEGHLQFNQYEDKDGNKRTSVEVIVDTFEFADSKKKEGSNNAFAGAKGSPSNKAPLTFEGAPVEDMDTPF